jgi:hypothetical protein
MLFFILFLVLEEFFMDIYIFIYIIYLYILFLVLEEFFIDIYIFI